MARATGRVLTATIAITPLCLLPGVFLSHDVIPKVVATLSGAAVLLFLLSNWANGIRALRGFRESRLLLALAAAQFVSLSLATVFSDQPALGFAGTVWRRLGAVEYTAALTVAVAAACMAIQQPGWVKSLYRAISITGGIGAIYGIAQYFRLDPFLNPALYTIEVFGGVVRPPATMGHAIYFAAWLVPVVLLAAGHAASAETGEEPDADRIWTRIHATVAALGCIAILLSGTRGAVLAIAAGATVLLPHSRNLARRLALYVSLLIAAAALFVLSPAGANLRNRLYQWRQDLGGPRLLLFRESPALLWNHPLLGTGPETFAVEFRKIESPEMSRAYPDFYHETPHNALIDAATSQGIPGLLILASLFVLGFRAKQPGLRAAIVGIFVSAMFASLTIVETTFLWTLAAVSVALQRPVRVKTKPLPSWTRVAAIPVGIAFLATAAALAVPDAADERLFEAVAANNFTAAASAFRSAISSSFGLPGYELFLSREMATLARGQGNPQQAQEAWKYAAEASALAESRGEERFTAAYQSSILAIAASDLPRSEREARLALDLAPNWYRPHLLLAQILQATGRTAEATAEQATGIGLGPRR